MTRRSGPGSVARASRGVGTLWVLIMASSIWVNSFALESKISVSELLLAISGLLLLAKASKFRVRLLAPLDVRVLMLTLLWSSMHFLWALWTRSGSIEGLKDFVSVAYYLVSIAMLSLTDWRRTANLLPRLFSACAIMLWISVQTSTRAVRATGSFEDPNLAGSVAASLILGLLLVRTKETSFVTLLGILAGGQVLFVTNSMSALSSLILAVAFWSSRRKRALTRAVALLAAAALAVGATQLFGALISSERFSRSRDGRIEIWHYAISRWTESPLGIGAGTFSVPELGFTWNVDTHNDFLQALLFFGPLGLIVFAALLAALWRAAGVRGRAVLIFLIASSATINAFNFRTIWLVFGACVFLDRTVGEASVLYPLRRAKRTLRGVKAALSSGSPALSDAKPGAGGRGA